MKQCPECSGMGHVLDTRPTPEANTRRRYECKECGAQWKTLEMLAPEVRSLLTADQTFHQAQLNKVGILLDTVEDHYKLLGEAIKDLKRGEL